MSNMNYHIVNMISYLSNIHPHILHHKSLEFSYRINFNYFNYNSNSLSSILNMSNISHHITNRYFRQFIDSTHHHKFHCIYLNSDYNKDINYLLCYNFNNLNLSFDKLNNSYHIEDSLSHLKNNHLHNKNHRY
jgi:hypothetical protein